MAYEDILYEKQGHIARITFNRPRSRRMVWNKAGISSK